MNSKIIYIRLFTLFVSIVFYKQTQAQGIELVQAGSLEGTVFKGQEVRKLTQNVVLKNGNMLLFCDTAYQFVATSNVEAYGHVRIQENGKFDVTGKKLVYTKTNNLATITDNVVLTTKDGSKLYTPVLDYDFKNKNLHYFGGGTIEDKGSVLKSQQGHYDINSKIMTFKKDVKIKGQDFESESDTLQYNTETKTAYFISPTKIKSKDGDLITERGEYNTATKKSKFSGRTSIVKDDFSIVADKLDYDEAVGYGYARGNVKIVSLKDSIIVTGEEAEYKGKSYLRVNNNALLRKKEDGDTLYIKADTLLSIDDSIKKISVLRAFNHAKILKKDFSAICDSLVYNRRDSVINFYHNPVLWSNNSQMTADSLYITIRKEKIDKMYMNQNAFLISQDSAYNFNQMKGKRMLASFDKGKINQVDVNGNGESNYFAMDQDSIFLGMNYITCGKMIIRFDSSNAPKTFTFLNKPEAKFIPPSKLSSQDKKLKGFVWRIKEMPTLETMYAYTPPFTKSEKKKEEKAKQKEEKNRLKEEKKNNRHKH
ncbi:MAG: OstA-like protein [Cytophagales bacterium]